MNKKGDSFIKFKVAEGLMPKEEMLEVSKKQACLTIGIPKEISLNENRVVIVPEAAGLFVANGHRVIVENNAGLAAHFENEDYAEVGAQIVYSPQEVYQADIILKVAPLAEEEI